MRIYFDGGAAPNPGAMHAAITINGMTQENTNLGHGTNNLAEWHALLWAMRTALEMGGTEVEIMGDSMLVVMQSTGKWKINKPEFLPLKADFDRLKSRFKRCVVRHIGRDKNIAGQQIEIRLKAR